MRVRCVLERHRERDVQRGSALVHVVGVHDQRLRKLARRARELAQDEHAAIVVSRGDELLGDQIHPVVQAADEAEIGAAIVFIDLLWLVVLRHENDRRVLAASETVR